MKKLLLSVILAVAGMHLMGQTGLHIGFFGGPQYSMILNNQPLDPTGKGFKYVPTFGSTGTFKVGYNIVPPIGVFVGATYSKQGQDYKTVDSVGTESSTSRRMTYIKVPVLLHLSSTPGPVMFVMEVGPQFAIMRDALIQVNGTTQNFTFPTEQLWKATDIEVAWALGAEFGISKGVHIVVQHRGDYGAFDSENKNVTDNGIPFYQSDRKKANNMTLSVVAGMEFVLKGAHSKVTRHYKGRTWRNNWR